MASGCRSDSGSVVSRPGTGTLTTGAESGTTLRRSSSASPSSGVPSAVASSSCQVPDADGGAASRPENRAPFTARRERPPPRRHAAAASGTLAAPFVKITVPSGIATTSGPGTSGSSARPRYSGYRAVSSTPARNAGSATLTRRSMLRRLPLEARRYRSDSSGPMRRVAWPTESSATGAGRHGSPGPRVQRMARVAAGTSTVTVTLSPRRTAARSTARRTAAGGPAGASRRGGRTGARGGDPRDGAPGAPHGGAAGGQHQPGWGERKCGAGAREQHGSGGGVRVGPPEPPQGNRRVGHRVAL